MSAPTKLDKARLVVSALYGKTMLVPAHHPEVATRARARSAWLDNHVQLALAAFRSTGQRLCAPVADVPAGDGWQLYSGNCMVNVWVLSAPVAVAPARAKATL